MPSWRWKGCNGSNSSDPEAGGSVVFGRVPKQGRELPSGNLAAGDIEADDGAAARDEEVGLVEGGLERGPLAGELVISLVLQARDEGRDRVIDAVQGTAEQAGEVSLTRVAAAVSIQVGKGIDDEDAALGGKGRRTAENQAEEVFLRGALAIEIVLALGGGPCLTGKDQQNGGQDQGRS